MVCRRSPVFLLISHRRVLDSCARAGLIDVRLRPRRARGPSSSASRSRESDDDRQRIDLASRERFSGGAGDPNYLAAGLVPAIALGLGIDQCSCAIPSLRLGLRCGTVVALVTALLATESRGSDRRGAGLGHRAGLSRASRRAQKRRSWGICLIVTAVGGVLRWCRRRPDTTSDSSTPAAPAARTSAGGVAGWPVRIRSRASVSTASRHESQELRATNQGTLTFCSVTSIVPAARRTTCISSSSPRPAWSVSPSCCCTSPYAGGLPRRRVRSAAARFRGAAATAAMEALAQGHDRLDGRPPGRVLLHLRRDGSSASGSALALGPGAAGQLCRGACPQSDQHVPVELLHTRRPPLCGELALEAPAAGSGQPSRLSGVRSRPARTALISAGAGRAGHQDPAHAIVDEFRDAADAGRHHRRRRRHRLDERRRQRVVARGVRSTSAASSTAMTSSRYPASTTRSPSDCDARASSARKGQSPTTSSRTFGKLTLSSRTASNATSCAFSRRSDETIATTRSACSSPSSRRTDPPAPGAALPAMPLRTTTTRSCR